MLYSCAHMATVAATNNIQIFDFMHKMKLTTDVEKFRKVRTPELTENIVAA